MDNTEKGNAEKSDAEKSSAEKWSVDKLTHKIIGCAMKVHYKLGNCFTPEIYQRAMSIEMEKQGLTFQKSIEVGITYEDIPISTKQIDFVVESQVMVELRVLEKLHAVHRTQAINYCKLCNITDGLIINFGTAALEFNRVYYKKPLPPAATPTTTPTTTPSAL